MTIKEQPTTSKKVRGNTPGRTLSKMFSPAKEEYTAEEIMAKCPDSIDAKSISLKGSTYNNRRKTIHKYKSKGRKFKWYNENDRIEAASVYALTGNAKRVEEITGIPSERVRQWKTTEWWPQIIDRIRAEKDDELDVKLTKMIDKSVKAINDRLDKGDYIYDTRTGDFKRKPMGGKEVAVMTSIFVDKRELIRKKKDIKTEQTTINDRLKKLADEFTKFVKMRTIEGEVINHDTDEGQEEGRGNEAGQEALLITDSTVNKE